MIDRRGIFSYLAITFVITYAVEGALIASGFHLTGAPVLYGQLVIVGVMWVPTLATILTIRYVTHEGFGITNVALGVIWGLWHAPLILVGFNYPGYPILGIVGMAGMTTALSLYINELTLRHQSSILAGWMHGVFNSQGYGIWRILFPDTNPLSGGMTGLVGIVVWTIIGIWEINRGASTANAL